MKSGEKKKKKEEEEEEEKKKKKKRICIPSSLTVRKILRIGENTKAHPLFKKTSMGFRLAVLSPIGSAALTGKGASDEYL